LKTPIRSFVPFKFGKEFRPPNGELALGRNDSYE